MAFKIEQRFEVQAPVERVWQYLIDPKRVVHCLPGAELLEQQDEHTFLGAIKVKVGHGELPGRRVDGPGRR